MQKKHSFRASQISRQHKGFGHILCTCHTVKYSMSCYYLKRLLNQVSSTYMKYTLPIDLLAVTFWSEEVSKFRGEVHFFIVFDNIICYATMCRNTIDFGYNSSHVALWCLEVVPVVYARVFMYAEWVIYSKVHKWMQYALTLHGFIYKQYQMIPHALN